MSIKNLAKRFTLISLILVLTTVIKFSQTGGNFEIEKSVVASGGNTSAGGNFTLESTSGQPTLNASPQDGQYQVLSGFWTPVFAPTAASVSVSGRVTLLNGRGMPRAIVSYIDGSGNIKTEQTSPFGYFRFTNVEVGQTYIFQVSAKGYLFAPQVINVDDSISSLNFSPLTKGQIKTVTKEDEDNLPTTNMK